MCSMRKYLKYSKRNDIKENRKYRGRCVKHSNKSGVQNTLMKNDLIKWKKKNLMLGFFTIFYHFYYPKTHLLQVAFLWQALLYNYLWTYEL